ITDSCGGRDLTEICMIKNIVDKIKSIMSLQLLHVTDHSTCTLLSTVLHHMKTFINQFNCFFVSSTCKHTALCIYAFYFTRRGMAPFHKSCNIWTFSSIKAPSFALTTNLPSPVTLPI